MTLNDVILGLILLPSLWFYHICIEINYIINDLKDFCTPSFKVVENFLNINCIYIGI